MDLYTSLTGRQQAQLYFLLGGISMKGGNNKRAVELFKHAQEAIPFQQVPHLVVISLVRSSLSEFLNDHIKCLKDIWMGL